MRDAQLGVEVAERLVEEQDLRPDDDGARQRHPLLLAAGELVRLLALVASQPDQLEHLGHRAVDLADAPWPWTRRP